MTNKVQGLNSCLYCKEGLCVRKKKMNVILKEAAHFFRKTSIERLRSTPMQRSSPPPHRRHGPQGTHSVVGGKAPKTFLI